MSARPQLRLPGLHVHVSAPLPYKLPVRPCPTEIGSIVDAEDNELLVVDPNNERDDAEVREICAAVADAINAWPGHETPPPERKILSIVLPIVAIVVTAIGAGIAFPGNPIPRSQYVEQAAEPQPVWIWGGPRDDG